MPLTDPQTLKNLLRKYSIEPTKYLGQNFLIDEKALQNLIDAANLSKDDVVIEVGAGVGTITVELLKRAKKVIAVEKDKALIPILKEATKSFKNIEIIVGDILKIDLSFVISHWSLIGNIPYYLTAPLLRKFLEAQNPPSLIVLMVQKEVAQRICASPPDMSILAVSVQVYAKPEIVAYVSRTSFWPTPKVDSAIIKVVPYPHDRKFNVRKFFLVLKTGFSNPRKQLINNLSKGLKLNRMQTEQWLASSRIDPKRRAETLSVDEWIRLSASVI
ncbi:MAG: ribosomal RNA small subunit methyltransferase A [Candidatus Spechtbacteria bacterium]|nr:ribosomal RNA small subunit methyltransferase A [Candidatus Spechtbacteria bacterium]